MEKKERNSVYVRMMADSLKTKEKILMFLYDQTVEQEKILKAEEPDLDRFQETIDEKGERITQLEQLDQGFDTLFRLVEKEIRERKEKYRDEILEMQELIRRVSELGVQIQAREKQNSERFKGYLARKRSDIREVRTKGRRANSYYQNMANVHKADQSYFINEIK